MAVYRCTTAFVTYDQRGGRRRYRPGQLVRGDDPVLKGRGTKFEAVEDAVGIGVVEQSSAAPGEKRSVRKSGKGAKKSEPPPAAETASAVVPDPEVPGGAG